MTPVATTPAPSAATLRPFTREPRELAALLAVLAELDAGPHTPAAYQHAARWLDKHVEPRVVAPEAAVRVPAWFIPSWVEELWLDAREPGRPMADDPNARPAHPWDTVGFFDHWGVTRVFGVTCFQVEPYNLSRRGDQWKNAGPGSAVALIRDVGRRCGGVGIWSPRAAWPSEWASRVLFFPRPDRFPAVLSPAWMRSYHRPDLILFADEVARRMRHSARPDRDRPQFIAELR